MIKLRVEIGQYEYVEAEYPLNTTPEALKLAHTQFKSAFGMQVPPSQYDTLKEKKFNEIVDDYLLGQINADDYADLMRRINSIKSDGKKSAIKDLFNKAKIESNMDNWREYLKIVFTLAKYNLKMGDK